MAKTRIRASRAGRARPAARGNTATSSSVEVRSTKAAPPPVSPLAPKIFASLAAAGRRAAGHGGSRHTHYQDRDRRAAGRPGARNAGRGRLHAIQNGLRAGRMVPRQSGEAGTARALVVNSGNANAFTGKAGQDGVRASRRLRPPPRSIASARKCSWPPPA